jgi:hypothetical protein
MGSAGPYSNMVNIRSTLLLLQGSQNAMASDRSLFQSSLSGEGREEDDLSIVLLLASSAQPLQKLPETSIPGREDAAETIQVSYVMHGPKGKQ